MRNLRIGVPSKGRLSELAGELLKQAGLSFAARIAASSARAGHGHRRDVSAHRRIPICCGRSTWALRAVI